MRHRLMIWYSGGLDVCHTRWALHLDGSRGKCVGAGTSDDPDLGRYWIRWRCTISRIISFSGILTMRPRHMHRGLNICKSIHLISEFMAQITFDGFSLRMRHSTLWHYYQHNGLEKIIEPSPFSSSVHQIFMIFMTRGYGGCKRKFEMPEEVNFIIDGGEEAHSMVLTR